MRHGKGLEVGAYLDAVLRAENALASRVVEARQVRKEISSALNPIGLIGTSSSMN